MAGPEPCQRRQGRRFAAPAAVAARSYQGLQIDKRPWDLAFLRVPRLFPKVVSEGVANGSRTSGNGALPGQGFHHFDRLFALPRPHDWASVPPLQTAPNALNQFAALKIRIFHDLLVIRN